MSDKVLQTSVLCKPSKDPVTTMLTLLLNAVVLCVLAATAAAQSASSTGYVGYNLTLEGDGDSVIYATDDTQTDASVTAPDPDVYLNATVFVQEIDLEVVRLMSGDGIRSV